MTFLVQLPISSYPDQLPPGFDQGTDFSYPTAQAMMWLSQLTYEPDDKIDAVLKRWQLRLLGHLHSQRQSTSATQGFVCQGGGATIVAFAGTDPGVIKTVLTDVNTKPDSDGMHPGFRDALDAVWLQVNTAIGGRTPGPLFVTGHSLGAALAVLAAFRLQTKENVTANAVYTFGLPRVGGQAFVDQYEPILGAITYRIVNGDDPVPSVPPTEVLGFRHVGRSLFCPHAGTFNPTSKPASVLDNEPNLAKVETDYAGHVLGELLRGRWPLPAQPGLLGWLYQLLPGGVADHMQARYLRALGTPVR